uniref:Uncharacterized protein n=1 Tax=Candidatus Kentrum sp. DK TaxID=2126562 RepID=A0A450SVB8_9GAMM|nr:MAG: protein of unknown function (DUF4469) with IG-like fold [Candidatus Kentron sp. DK]
MPINYALFENHLTSDPNDYAAQVQFTGSTDLDTIVRRITEQGSTWSESDIKAVLGETIRVCESLLLEGNRVNFGGLCELFPRVSGVFNGVTDNFDSARHRVDVGASPGSRVRKTVRDNAHVAKVEAIRPAPSPLEYVDLGSGEINGALTPGNIGTLNGHRLKFDPTKEDEGIFLIPAGNGAAQKITVVQRNKPGQLVFLIPQIKKGDYVIEVRARLFGGEELRVGSLGATLTV